MTNIESTMLVTLLILMLFSGLFFMIIIGSSFGFAIEAVGMLICVLVIGALVGLEMHVIDQRMLPNEGIRRSAKNGLLIGLVFGFIGLVVAFGYAFASGGGGFLGIYIGFFSFGFGMIFGTTYGGRTVLKHYDLRLLLFLSGTFPWNITAFLDSCAQRRLVQRVGGGWRFPHNLIRDYFAELDEAQIAELVAGREERRKG